MQNDEMKDRLLESLRELARVKPIDKITVRQIAENCGVTTQTFYNHFSDKYEIVHWAYRSRLDRLFDQLASGEITLDGFLRGYLSDYQFNANFILNAVKNTKGEDSYLTVGGRYFCQKIEEEMCRKLGVEELSVEYRMLIKMYVGGFTNLIIIWLSGKEDISLEDMVGIFKEAVPKKLKDAYLS